MAGAALRAVFFDLDGVVRRWDASEYAGVEAAAGLPSGAVQAVAFDPDLLHPAITGAVTDEVWRANVARRLRAAYPNADADLAVRLWSEPIGAVVADVLDLVRGVRGQVHVGLITNATTRLSSDLDRLGLDGEFDSVVNSSVVGVMKPGAGIFAAALAGAGCVASEAFFVDDSPANVEGAQQAGWHAAPFLGATDLARRLTEFGLRPQQI